MNIKLITITLALAAAALCAQAQEKKDNPNPWFLQGQMGATYSSGDADFGKLLSPGGQIAVGKYFSHMWGARLAVSGWQGRAGSERSNLARGFYYGAATVDGMMNLSQLIRRYHERPVDVSVIAGIGFNRTFSGSCASSFMGRLGLQASLRLNEAIDLNVEAMANGVSDRWNGRDDHGIDTYFNVGVGLTYKLRTGFKCISCLSTEYPEQVYTEEEVNQLINEQRAQIIETTHETVKHDTIIIEKAAEKVVRGIRSHVSFELGKTEVRGNQEINVLAVADYLKQHPEARATISGYADKGTGTAEINLRLAKQRAEAVRDCLVRKYGIDENRLTTTSMENDEQPFSTNDWNRVVVITAD
ncbi:MAG: OmpA family protein [Bacteroides sp.]|nr:OmpA family protein [Bacteroides sp.]